MGAAKIAISIDRTLLTRVDRLVKSRVFPNRSRAVQEAVAEKLLRLDRRRLARECARLDRAAEQRLAEEGLGAEGGEWPEY